jgi:Ca-activated chloride channel family protein
VTFVHPWVLLTLVVPVLLGFWLVQRRAFGLALPFDHATGHRRRPFLQSALTGFELLGPVLLAIVLLILARPQVLRVPDQQRVLTNIQICLDVSGSMGAEDRYGNATAAIEEFTRARDGDAFGLTLFGSEQVRFIPLTKDLQAIRNALPFASPDNQPMQMSGTSIGAAIKFCAKNMVAETDTGDRMLIVVSDGVSFDLQGNQGDEIVEELKLDEITLYYVHVGTGANTPVLTDIAEQTGGAAFIAEDKQAVERVFKHIDRMEPARFEPAAAVPMDEFFPFALAGLVTLGLWVLGRFGMRFTPW